MNTFEFFNEYLGKHPVKQQGTAAEANCHRLAHSEDPPLPLVTLRALVL